MKTETKYAKNAFDGYTHRFIVKFCVDDDWRNDCNMDVYSDSDSYDELTNFINLKKTDKVKSFSIEHRASKATDEASAKFIDEWLAQE